jgi:hypothetical protein
MANYKDIELALEKKEILEDNLEKMLEDYLQETGLTLDWIESQVSDNGKLCAIRLRLRFPIPEHRKLPKYHFINKTDKDVYK